MLNSYFGESESKFLVPIDLIFAEDWQFSGLKIENINQNWLDHNRLYAGAAIGRLWPHQRLFEYFRGALSIEQVPYRDWHQANFRLRDIPSPLNDHDLMVFRFEQFKKWERQLRESGISSADFILPARFDSKFNKWMLTDKHHRSAFLRTAGVRAVHVVAARQDWEQWYNAEGVQAVRDVIARQGRTEFYTPILHPDFQDISPLRDFAYKSRLDHILEFLGPRCRSGRLVDIGSNAGFFTHHFAREGFDVVGFDPDRNHHDLANALSRLYKLPAKFENTAFQAASSNERFDGALLLTVLYHFLDRGEHLPLLKKLDSITENFVIWESGSRPDDEKKLMFETTKFDHYIKIAETYGTGRSREMGIFSTNEFANRNFVDGQARPAARGGHVKKVFDYMATGQWLYNENQESVSGPGSTLSYTKEFRKIFENFLQLSNCSSIFDGPCGDFNWMKEVQFPPGMMYYGGDIASELITTNRQKFSGRKRLFFEIDLTTEPLPEADIWLCRDCLFHLSYFHARQVLKNALRNSFEYWMFTSHVNETNSDAVTGSFRELNLMAAPFNFPAPLMRMVDYVEGFPERYVGVWSREQVLAAVSLMEDVTE